jgi:hypothetical protein
MRKLNVEWKGRSVKIHVHKHPALHYKVCKVKGFHIPNDKCVYPWQKWVWSIPSGSVATVPNNWLTSTQRIVPIMYIHRAAYATLHQWQLISFLKMTAFWDVVSLKYNDVSEVCTACINSTSGMLVYFNKTTRCCIPKGYHLHTHHYENLKPKNNVWLLICFVSDDIYPVLW